MEKEAGLLGFVGGIREGFDVHNRTSNLPQDTKRISPTVMRLP